MEKANETSFFQKMIFAMYVLKVKFDFSKKSSGLLILMSNLQPLFIFFELKNTNLTRTLTLSMERSKENRNTYIFELLQILFRPSIKLISIFDQNVEYAFFVVTILVIIHKIGLIYFTQHYLDKEKSLNLKNQAENSFFSRLFCNLLNIYQQLVGSYLYLEMNFICIKCYSKQTGQLENFGVLLVTLNISTMLLLAFDSIGTIIINECTITNKVYGLEKLSISIYRYIQQVLIIIQSIIVIFFDQIHIEYILSGIFLFQQLILIFELLIDCNYILRYQTYPLILATSINLSFCLSIFIVSTSDTKLFTFCCLIFFSLIMIILKNQNQQIEKQQIVQLFRSKKNNLNFLRYGLIKILNNEIYFQKEDLIIKILIAKWHSSRCKSKHCTFCNHIFIQNTEQCSGITNEIFKQFILYSISYFMQKPSLNRKRYNQQEYALIYAYFLYDFGWMIRSIKILDSIFSNNFSHKYQKNFQQTSQFSFQENDMQLKDNELQPNSILLQLNYIRKVQTKFIVQCGKTQIISSLTGFSLYATQQSMIQEYIEKSLKSESLIQYLERKIMDTLILKQNFYNILKNSCQELIDDLDFNKQLYSLCEQVYEVNKILKFNFQNTPNQKIHGLYTFFIGEILSNYYKSVQFYKNSKCLEVELNKFQQIINFNINQKNVHYTILELCDDMQNLNLIGHSQNFHDNFGTCQKKQKLFEHLLPDCLIPYHNLYVKRFFETGTSKYFNIFQINFIMSNTQNILTTVNMCYSVTNLFKSKNMIFAVFLQESTQDKAYLFVDGNNLKCKFTKNLMIQIGWSIPDIEDQIKIKEILQVEILQIYPDFLNVIENKENEIKLNQITMYFPSLSNYLDQIENKSKQSPDRGRQNLRYIAVVCDILIQRREIGDFCYYLLDIVKMAELIKIRKKTTIHKVELLKQIKQNKYQNDEEYIVYQQDDSPNIGNLNSVNFINQQQIGSIQNSTKPLVLQVNPMFVSNSPVLNSRREDTINQTEQQLITQKLSLLKEDLGSPSLQSNDDEEKSQKSKGIQLQETQTETDKIQLKYSLINQIISASTTRYQKNFMVLFSIWFSIFITFIIVLQIELNNDLEDFLSYGFMTSFYASIMGPHDLYFSMRVALTTYQQMNREGFLPSSQMKQFIAPIQEIVDLGYIELRDSFYDQLNNPYIQNFLNDAKVIMNFMNKNEQEVYPIEVSFRDALFTILQYQYAAMRTLQRGESNSGKPFQVSVFANQFMLHKECEKLTQSLYDYAIYMHSNMIQKLITLWLIFDIALIIFYIYLQNFQIKFFSQLDKFVSLIFLIDNPILNKEVIRYNNLMTSIKLNSDLLLNYNPEVQLQQHFNKPLQSHDNQNQNQKQKQSLQAIIKSRSLIKILNISFLIFLLSIILIFSLIIITSTSLFFSKYDDTLQFYQQVQQMKFRPGNLILYREIFFRWQNFTFLTQNNKVELYDLINKAQNSIYNYILTSNSINYDLYLIDSNFIDLFEDINKNNLCNFIDEKFKNSSQIYCQFSFDGSFSNGMISALNYITNYIKSQQAINNFTRRVEIQYYEAEGSQIVSRVFSNLVNQFNSSLKLQFDGMKLFLTVLSFSFIITTIVIQILLFYFYSPYLGRIMKIIKRVVYLIPFESLMKNELLVRQLKELKFKFQ